MLIAPRRDVPNPVGLYWLERAPFHSDAWVFARMTPGYRLLSPKCWSEGRFDNRGQLECYCKAKRPNYCLEEYACEVLAAHAMDDPGPGFRKFKKLLLEAGSISSPGWREWIVETEPEIKVEYAGLDSRGISLPPKRLVWISDRYPEFIQKFTYYHELAHIFIYERDHPL